MKKIILTLSFLTLTFFAKAQSSSYVNGYTKGMELMFKGIIKLIMTEQILTIFLLKETQILILGSEVINQEIIQVNLETIVPIKIFKLVPMEVNIT